MDWKAWLFPPPRRITLNEADYFLPDLCRGEGVLGIIMLSALLSILIVVAQSGLVEFDWVALGKVSLMALVITLASAWVLCQINPLLAGLSRVSSALISYGLILLTAFLCSAVAEQLLALGRSGGFFDPWRVGEHILLAAIPAGILLRYLLLQQELRIQQRAELEARIQALQSRIRPHFLFNSMNMVASLIGSDPEKAERVVEDLSDLFRRALADSQTLVPLREELALCRSYLELEKLRLGDRLQTVWEIGDYGAGAQIPCLSLQPVLENAVYHGIQLLPQGGEIEVKVKRVKDRIEIAVRNPIYPRMQYNKGTKMAMENVRLRLQAHFGPSASVSSSVQEGRYVTCISYPLMSVK
jgi:two-component system sensor histidine kinase AlgZ